MSYSVKELRKNGLEAFHFCLLRLIPSVRHVRQYLLRLARTKSTLLYWAPEITIEEQLEMYFARLPDGWYSWYLTEHGHVVRLSGCVGAWVPLKLIDTVRLNARKIK